MAATPMDPRGFRYLPVTGPAIDAYEAAREGDVGGAALNAGLAVADVALLSTGVGAAGAFARGTARNAGRMTANAVRAQMRRRGVTKAGQELHHSIELNGIPRNVENWRNHPAFMKPLAKASHRRLHGRWGDLPEYNSVQKLWVGTPTWMKTVPTGTPRLVERVAALSETEEPNGLPRPTPYGERPLR
jgi:hypothetical protein